eukprot:c22328_g1_i1 orf=1-852(-)
MGNSCVRSSWNKNGFFFIDSKGYSLSRSEPVSSNHESHSLDSESRQEGATDSKSESHVLKSPPQTIVIHPPVLAAEPPVMPRSKDSLVMLCRSLTPSVLRRQTENLNDLYVLGRKLGQGQFGTTYLCIEKSTGKEYACKSISKRKLISQEDVDDVQREIHIMYHVSEHPNIVTIKGAYEDSMSVHLVMELCEGGELFDRIIQRGHYTERKAADLIRTIVGVVQACHSLGVMHRDLKPENFLFSNKNEDSPLKTIDFGLSVFFKPGELFHDVVGSPYYVAPEVLR